MQITSYLHDVQNPASKVRPKKAKKKSNKKSKYDDFTTAPSDAIYFLFDVETTGSKRNWDRIIAVSFLAYDREGNLLGSFNRKINPGKVQVASFLSQNVHGK